MRTGAADRGNAAVEFVAVVPLVLLVGLTVLQLALLAHAKAIVTAAAAQSARAAAVSSHPEAAAQATATEVIADGLGAVPIGRFEITRGEAAGSQIVTVRIEARPRLALMPDVAVVVGTGHALVEQGS